MVGFLQLFNQSDLIKYSENISVSSQELEIVQDWCEKLRNNNLTEERSNYLNFYDFILRELLGYTPNDREFEQSTDKGRHVEFCIIDEDKKPILIFELKGQNVKLDIFLSTPSIIFLKII